MTIDEILNTPSEEIAKMPEAKIRKIQEKLYMAMRNDLSTYNNNTYFDEAEIGYLKNSKDNFLNSIMHYY